MKKLILTLSLLAIAAMSATRVTPINSAEAIFAPFWDSTLGEHLKWSVTHGRIELSFPAVYFYWEKKKAPSKDADVEMTRAESFSCEGYDHLIFFGRVPMNDTLRITLETDKGTLTKEWLTSSSASDEYLMPLDGATTIDKITFQLFELPESKSHSGLLLWYGLQNAAKLEEFMKERQAFASQPLDVFLAPKGTEATFKGKVGLLGSNEMIEKAQGLYQQYLENGGNPIAIDGLDTYKPELSIADCSNIANQMMFGRPRDRVRNLRSITDLLKKGLIAKDQKMMEAAAHTAIVYGLIPNWDCTCISDFRDSSWDQRVFAHAAIAEQVAIALDYTSELMSPAGRQLLYRRLGEYAIGWINYNIWRYTYLFGNNQLSVFSRGRIAAYLVLEKAEGWNTSRIPPYTDLAFKEMLDSVAILVHPDGSFLEGPPYFNYTLTSVQPILEMYSMARRKPLADITPDCLKNLANFADVFISTDRRGSMIPVSSGQGNGRGTLPTLAQFFAIIAPESQWVKLYHEAVNHTTWVNDIFFLNRMSLVRASNPPVRPLAELPVMGMMASTRFVDLKVTNPICNHKKVTKLLLCGTKKAAKCHRHNDRGSFVLEYGGDTFAADPGGQSYADEDGHLVKRSDYHNMLVPANMPDNEPLAVSSADIRPVGTGDETSFHAEINPQPSSELYFKSWHRVFDSPNPRTYSITDSYELKENHSAASFLWITELPFKKIAENQVRIEGESATAIITFPNDMTFSSEVLIVRKKEKYNRLRFTRNQPSGTFTIHVAFQDE